MRSLSWQAALLAVTLMASLAAPLAPAAAQPVEGADPVTEADQQARVAGDEFENGLAKTPPMGWNDWYTFFCDIDEEMIKETADAMVSSGMREAGYEYVNIDDCWSAMERGPNGELVADPERFPSGIKALADYVHARGLKLGIYTDVGTKTCAGYPGGYGHEAQDVNTFAEWDVDFVKVDWCNVPFADFPGKSKQEVAVELYSRWTRAFEAAERTMVFSICVWEEAVESWEWAPALSNMWRTSTDYGPTWPQILKNGDDVAPLWQYARPGHWNDPDILMVGFDQLNATEQQSHFSTWAMAAAPLLAGNDLRDMSDETVGILTNREVLAVDQDRLGVAGHKVRATAEEDVWVRPLENGDTAVLLVNRTAKARMGTISADELGMDGLFAVRDLYQHETTSARGTLSAYLPAHGSAMFRLSEPADTPPMPHVAWGIGLDDSSSGLSKSVVSPGSPNSILGQLRVDGVPLIEEAAATLEVPDGWTVQPDTAQAVDVNPKKTTTAPWTVTPPDDTPAGEYDLVATLDYLAADVPGSTSGTLTVTVPQAPPAGTSWLSDVDWVEASNGYGPVLLDRNYYGSPLSIDATTYEKGVWTHAPSSLGYYVGGDCSRLTATLGIDDVTGSQGSVTFEVWADGERVFDSGRVVGADAGVPLDVDLSGRHWLRLVSTDAGDGINFDHSVWAGAKLTCADG